MPSDSAIRHFRPAQNGDVLAITEIYNEGIASGLGTFETRLREPSEIEAWLPTIERYPLWVATLDNQVVGFARLSSYRDRPCYDGIAEFSIYLKKSAQGQGIGRELLTALLAAATDAGFHKVFVSYLHF
ncbi:GNAT family N-acetyltransferase [Saccharospirillum mangrovi]|uniref:GNAT family N-acetyltransferase n=1 Tax=Saccharospirillum mangrovi TaxID=2161747 RepID=UPI001E4ADFE3|nr:GNAT family N-acetyltransferase [Saccharospirillum mangrovi]